ncbi:isochorismatase family protein [Dietzia sp.]|uniref:isochorismatase family protein n=1 Tax=Dietzia sp. TaxID=1871616 RepID=UPI002FD96F7B
MSRADALLVVDVQNDFCPGGALGVAGADGVAERVAELLAGEHGYRLVVATRDMHVDPGAHFSDTPDFVDTWPVHCVRGTAGAELRPELAGVHFDAIFDKGAFEAAYSGFEGRLAAGEGEGAALAEWLRAAGVRSVDVVGIATDHCVRATASDALREGFVTAIRADLTAAVDPQRGRAALDELATDGAEIRGHLQS